DLRRIEPGEGAAHERAPAVVAEAELVFRSGELMRAEMRVRQLADAGRADETHDVLLLHREARIAVKRGEEINGAASAGDDGIGYGSHGDPGETESTRGG